MDHLALSLYVPATTLDLNIETWSGPDAKAAVFSNVGASPFVFEAIGYALVLVQEATDVEHGPLFNALPALLMCFDSDVRSVNRNICVGLLVRTIQEPKGKAERHFSFRHRLGFGRLAFVPHHSIPPIGCLNYINAFDYAMRLSARCAPCLL